MPEGFRGRVENDCGVRRRKVVAASEHQIEQHVAEEVYAANRLAVTAVAVRRTQAPAGLKEGTKNVPDPSTSCR